MEINEKIKRYLILVLGLFIMAFGVAFSIKADLGISPISSLPYVGSLITKMTVGNLTILMNVIFITLQIIILGKQYELIQLTQLPAVIIFGKLMDLTLSTINENVSKFFKH